MIIEVDLPHELVAALTRLVDNAAGVHPDIRQRTRNRLVTEALAFWLEHAALYEPEHGLLLNPARPRPSGSLRLVK